MFILFIGDFMPYSDVGNQYWTGYFTTRPFYKRMDRIVQSRIRFMPDWIIIQISIFCFRLGDQLLAFAQSKGLAKYDEVAHYIMNELRLARRNLAIFQHHDAITGTARPLVVQNYAKL